MAASAADGEIARKIEEYKAREHIYLAGLIGQEAELTKLRCMASDVLGAYGDVSRAAVRGGLFDPTQNLEVLMLRQRARERDTEIDRLREELEANRFDQKLPAGQALMKKCKALLTENRELGEEIKEERLADLRGAFQAEQRRNGELLARCSEASEFCKTLSQENEKLQGTIARVAGRLREARTELEALRKERAEAKAQRKKERDLQKKAAPMQAASAVTEAAPAPTPAPGPPSVFESGPATTVAPPVAAPLPDPVPVAVEVMQDLMPPPTMIPGPRGEQADRERKDRKRRKTEGGAEDFAAKDKKQKKRRRDRPATGAGVPGSNGNAPLDGGDAA